MKRLAIFALLSLSTLITCKDKGTATATHDANPGEAEKYDISKGVYFHKLAPMPFDDIKDLFNTATYVDYIFHDLPFSLSQDEIPAVQANIGMISTGPPVNFKPECKSLGREFFHVDGDIVWEAEVFFDLDNGCSYYVFYEPKSSEGAYINAISDSGVKFYSNLLKQNFQQQ